ncbi:calcium/proton exchanger [bacterium]|nr:calcium/proton exchanger [bacterium]
MNKQTKPTGRLFFEEFAHNPMMWLLVAVPLLFIFEHTKPESHILLFFLSVAAIIPLAGLLSHATESVSAKTGDLIGGLLNATLGNLTELVIAVTALRQGMIDLVKASITGAVVTNTLFMLGTSFLLGGIKHRTQQFNRATARVQTGLLLLATIALLIPSAINSVENPTRMQFAKDLSLWLSVLLIAIYALSLFYSLKTHREFFASAAGDAHEEEVWPLSFAIVTLAVVTVLIALVSEIFVSSVQDAAVALGMTPAFVGFIIVSLVGAAAEMVSAFSAARKNRLDLSVGIAMGSSAQIALFVAPVLLLLSYVIAPNPMDLSFGPGQVLMVLLSTMTVSFVANTGQSSWFSGIQLLSVYLIFAMTLYLLPQR